MRYFVTRQTTEKPIIQGITAEKRERGRAATIWEKDIEEWTEENIGDSHKIGRIEICEALLSPSQQLGLEYGGFFGPADKKQEVAAATQVVPAATQEVATEMQE